MKKNLYYTILLLMFLIVSIFIFDNKKYINYNGFELALVVDGVNKDSIPPKGNYRVSVNCGSTGEGFWDYDLWRLNVKNANGNVKCDLKFTSINPNENRLNEKIISLAKKPSDDFDWINDGIVVEEIVNFAKSDDEIATDGFDEIATDGFDEIATDGFSSIEINDYSVRYEGRKVNNYVRFNNEMWRIIGVFDENTHGIEGKKLVKLIREESLGNFSWNRYDENNKDGANWSKSILNTLLNEYYYKKRNYDSNLGDISNYCNIMYPYINGNCNFELKGISDVSRNMIVENAKWYVLGTASQNNPVKLLYYFERHGEKREDDYPEYVENPVGLMYVSDYGYSSGEKCYKKENLINYSYPCFDREIRNAPCDAKSWIHTKGSEWTINPSTMYTRISTAYEYFAFVVDESTFDSSSPTYYAYNVRPTVYLKENTFIYQGDGSYGNPYVIGID